MKQRIHHTHPYLLDPQHPVTITLVGCGGNGSQALMQLARIDAAMKKLGHVGLHVTVFDHDVITEANLARQLFFQQELGMNKAVALVTRVNRAFGTSWKAMPIKFTTAVKQADRCSNITISCLDNITGRKAVKQAVGPKSFKGADPEYRTLYWMDLGNAQETGQFVLGSCGHIPQRKGGRGKLPNILEKFPAMKKQKEKDSGPSCSLAEALNKQDLFINSTLVQLAMGLLWKMFREGKISYHGAFLNLQTLHVAPIQI